MDRLAPCNDLESGIQRYAHSVQSLAFTYLKNHQDAEDIAQDVFLAYMTKAPRFQEAAKEKAWLMKVTVNCCKSLLRRAYRTEVELNDQLCYLPEEESWVLEAVLKLDEKYRICIHLHYYEGYTLSEIGKLLHCPAATVGSRLARGREQLKTKLGGDYFEKQHL